MALSEDLLKKIIKGVLAAVAIAAVLYIAYLFLDIITMFIISVLLAFIFNPVVAWMEGKGIKRVIAVIIVMVSSLVLVTIAFGTLIPKITSQVQTLTTNLSQEKVNEILGGVEQQFKSIFPFYETVNFAENVTNFLSGFLVDTVNNLSNILSSIFSILALAVIVPFMTFFLLRDSNELIKGIISVMPNRYFEMSYSVLKKMSIQLGKFVRAWILDALFVGTMSALGLTILGVDNSITIGMIAGIGHLIPYFGPLIGGIPAIIIALLQFGDTSILLSIVLMFVIIYTLDNGYIQPNLLSHGTDMHPLVIIILILFGSQVMGILGMLIAVPLATVIKTAAREINFGYKNYKIINLK